MIREPHVRLFWDGDMLCAVWHDFANLVNSDAGFGRTVSQACENLFASTGEERLTAFQLRPSRQPDIDFTDSLQVDQFLARIIARVVQEEVAGVGGIWCLSWEHGVMSFQGGSEREGRATAALFAHLWLRGIDCGLARDLACSYFDSRIGRTA